MARRPERLTDALYFLVPQLLLFLPRDRPGNGDTDKRIAPGDRRPTPTNRPAGWSHRRRYLRGLNRPL